MANSPSIISRRWMHRNTSLTPGGPNLAAEDAGTTSKRRKTDSDDAKWTIARVYPVADIAVTDDG
jgi:hypothetical protein